MVYKKRIKTRQTERRQLEKELDDLFRHLIRLRDVVCQRTNKRDNLQVAHFITRTVRATRWDENNACLLNGGSHRWAHTFKTRFRDFWVKRIGEEEVQKLEMKERSRLKITNEEKRVMKLALKKRIQELTEERIRI